MKTYAERYHDFSAGHRVVGHEGKCVHLHGHNYRVHFRAEADVLDGVGRVVDFSVLKSECCMWLERHWDHKLLLWNEDPEFSNIGVLGAIDRTHRLVEESAVWCSFNPTAENMAQFLLTRNWGLPTGIRIVEVRVEETRKCMAMARVEE